MLYVKGAGHGGITQREMYYCKPGPTDLNQSLLRSIIMLYCKKARCIQAKTINDSFLQSDKDPGMQPRPRVGCSGITGKFIE